MTPFISNFALRFRNAKAVIRQIKDDEWKVRENGIDGIHYSARRGEFILWLANGAFFCDLQDADSRKDRNAFGLIWRHWVWWAAARKLKREADAKSIRSSIPRL